MTMHVPGLSIMIFIASSKITLFPIDINRPRLPPSLALKFSYKTNGEHDTCSKEFQYMIERDWYLFYCTEVPTFPTLMSMISQCLSSMHAAEMILKDSSKILCSCILILKLCKRPGAGCFALPMGVSLSLDL